MIHLLAIKVWRPKIFAAFASLAAATRFCRASGAFGEKLNFCRPIGRQRREGGTLCARAWGK